MLLIVNLYDVFVLSLFFSSLLSTVVCPRDLHVTSAPTSLDQLPDHRGLRERHRGARDLRCLLPDLPRTVGACRLNGLATGAYLLVLVAVVVIVLRPDCNVVGQVFCASFVSAAVTFIVYAAFLSSVATPSVLEVVTAAPRWITA